MGKLAHQGSPAHDAHACRCLQYAGSLLFIINCAPVTVKRNNLTFRSLSTRIVCWITHVLFHGHSTMRTLSLLIVVASGAHQCWALSPQPSTNLPANEKGTVWGAAKLFFSKFGKEGCLLHASPSAAVAIVHCAVPMQRSSCPFFVSRMNHLTPYPIPTGVNILVLLEPWEMP